MRVALWSASILLLLASAQAEANPVPAYEFGLYADHAATADSVFDEGGPEPLTIYMILTIDRYLDPFWEPMAIRFSAPNPPCFEGTLIHENYAFPSTGTAQTGVLVMFGNCQTGQLLVGTLMFTVWGLTGDCCWYVPQPWPGRGAVEVQQCGLDWYEVFSPSMLLINPNNCPSPTPVEESTWGRIKVLYQQ